ncbi:hypothetical protein [Methylobacterium currus]|nr:hypothetical protein [Methylobacterium currus]
MIHATDDGAKRFSRRCAELTDDPEDSRTLFLPIETAVAVLA